MCVSRGLHAPRRERRPPSPQLQNLRGEVLCEVELGNVTRDERKVKACTLDAHEPVILRVNLDPATIDWRARVDGAVDFEPYNR